MRSRSGSKGSEASPAATRRGPGYSPAGRTGSARPVSVLLPHDLDLLGVFHDQAELLVLLGHGAADADRLALEVRRGLLDAGPGEGLGTGLGDDDAQVLRVVEVLFGVEVDFAV